MRKAILLILDGWGLGQNPDADAILAANTPVMDDLMRRAPHTTLTTFGEEVGLPHGQMGNSEVGHMNIGAGRIVYQDLLRIDRAIDSGAFFTNKVLLELADRAKSGKSKLHLIGLLSDGGVHSQLRHLFALVDFAEAQGIERTYIHGFLDGRDTDPHGGKKYVEALQEQLKGKKAKLASVVGRYYAMDRDQRWERTKVAYDLLVHGNGIHSEDILRTLPEQYEKGQTDEFMEPILLDKEGLIEAGDTVLFFNFRADRPRQLTSMLKLKDYPEVGTTPLDIAFYTMTPYDKTFEDVRVIYDKKPLERTFGELLATHGRTQLRMAETEKYPHVTYFFSGGREQPFEGERRILVNSPKVATYDLKPSMSAVELTEALLSDLTQRTPDFICLNFANTDMVGHTGVFKAAIEAAETVDTCVGRILDAALPKGYHFIIIADHGNADFMINADGTPNTAHSKNPVPCIYVDPDKKFDATLTNGILADIAVTLSTIMGIEPFEEMTGKNLISK